MKNKLIKDSLLFNWRKDEDLSKLINILYKHQEIRFVGGCVRDALLGNKIVDIDFAINCKPEITKDILTENGFKICVKGIKFGSISTVVNGKKFEITSLRKDIETFGRFAKVEYTDSWEEDSLRRDLTINSLYLSTDGHIFDKHNGIKDIKGNLEGPLLPGRVSFFASGRIKRDSGYLYGQRVFKPNTFIWDANANNFVVDSTVGLGNSFQPVYQNPTDLVSIVDSLIEEKEFDWVPMNWHEQKTSQIKLTVKVTPRIKFSLNRMDSDTRQQYYSHLYKWNPDGRSHYFNTRVGNLFRLDLSLSQSTFASFMVSKATNHYRNHLKNDPNFYKEIDFDFSKYQDIPIWFWEEYPTLDSTVYFVDPRIFDYTPVYNYYVGGQSMGFYNRKSVVETYKSEITSQINQKHQLKSGFEYRRTKISLTDLTVQLASYTGFQPVYQDPSESPTSDTYGKQGRTPEEFSFYVQDKMETKNMVVNIGLRWDYFDPNWKVVNDLRDPNYLDPLRPINEYYDLDGDGAISEFEATGSNLKTDSSRLQSNAFGEPWFREAKPKTQISPRFALAFPITDKGYLHFSYGHFFQNPEFSYLYSNPEFEVPPSSGAGYTMGNADMEPQRTTQYEVGFSQQIGQDIGIEITGYFKDIRNLNSTKIIQSIVAGDRYGLYINKDFANSRGITVALSKRRSNKVSGNIDYTYSISEGNASDPTAAFYDEQSNIEPEKVLVPLDWDQRHTLNATLTYHPIKNSGLSFVFNYGSGFPICKGISRFFGLGGLRNVLTLKPIPRLSSKLEVW